LYAYINFNTSGFTLALSLSTNEKTQTNETTLAS
jgi:hypothetical protein